MRFVTYNYRGTRSFGLVRGDRVLDLPSAANSLNITICQSLNGLIEAGPAMLDDAKAALAHAADRYWLAVNEVGLEAPLSSLKKNIFCVGRNYVDHVTEGYRSVGKEAELPLAPQFFTKAPTALAGPDSEFVLDGALTSKLDYEVELGVVIGKVGKDIAREEARDHVFGFTVINDLTARDLQRRHDQWFKGKSLDGSAPMGPAIVTPDEIADLGEVELTATVNGELRQKACVKQMIFDIPEIIAQLSAGMTLEPGDVIATGTPSGVGYAMDPPRFLADGDVVECAIAQIGSIRTTIRTPGARK